jgi:hypothetical protein
MRRIAELSESKAECLAALEAAGTFAAGDASAWERLDHLADPLARAFVGYEHLRAGRLGRAERSRELLLDHQLARTPSASLLVQHLELVRGTLAHCDDEIFSTPDGEHLIEAPPALCWIFRTSPAEAVEAFNDDRDWRTSRVVSGCQKQLQRSAGRAAARLHAIARAAPHFVGMQTADCVNAYYGIGVRQDFEAAYSCARTAHDPKIQFLALMNGQGVTRDLAAAQHMLLVAAYWRTLNPLLADLLDARIAGPDATFKPVRYCDVAYTTPEIGECAVLGASLAEQQDASLRAAASKRLMPVQRRLLSRVQQFFVTRRDALAKLESFNCFGGSSCGTVIASQREWLEQWHARRLQRWLLARQLKPVGPSELRVAEATLGAAIEACRRNAPDLSSHDASPPTLGVSELFAGWPAAARAYRPALELAIASGKQYADAWVRLALSAAPQVLDPDQAERSVRGALATELARELGCTADDAPPDLVTPPSLVETEN